jgi:SAM-dependent methyltransferase
VDDTLLIFHVREARRKAMACAAAEAVCLLRDFDAKILGGGPLSDRGGLFWINIPRRYLEKSCDRLPRLGYSYAVDCLEAEKDQKISRRKGSAQIISWRGGKYRLNRLYEEEADLLRDRAPDRRLFALENEGGPPRLIRGYRGDGGRLSRRALAVCDARMLVNLVHEKEVATFLDPFAGAGGIVLEALDNGYHVLSADIDPILRAGLEQLGSIHYVADARSLPFGTATIDNIATEPPFDEQADQTVLDSLEEMYRVLKPKGRLAMLSAARQAHEIRKRAVDVGFAIQLDSDLNRKGMNCCVLALGKF